MTESKHLIPMPDERIIRRIFLIRGKKAMLDRHLAQLYGVETRVLNQAVRRNIKRFPEDFMFQLNKQEADIWKSQIVISRWGGTRKLPLAFTQEGVAMLSSVLNSERAIQVNIQIIRTFTKLRELIATNKDLRLKIESLESKYEKHDKKFRAVFDLIARLLTEKQKPKRPMGFTRSS